MSQIPHKAVLARRCPRLNPRGPVDVKSPAASQVPARIYLPDNTAEAIHDIPTYRRSDVVSQVHPVEVGRGRCKRSVDGMAFLDRSVPIQQIIGRRAVNGALPSEAIKPVDCAGCVAVVSAGDQAVLAVPGVGSSSLQRRSTGSLGRRNTKHTQPAPEGDAAPRLLHRSKSGSDRPEQG